MTGSIDAWRSRGGGRHVRLPDPDGPGAEGALAAANERARDDAVATLRRLLPGIDTAALAQRTDGSTLSLSTRATDIGFVPDPEGLMDRLIAEHDNGTPRLRVARDGAAGSLEHHLEIVHPTTIGPHDRAVSMATARVPGGRLASLLAGGGTLIVDGTDLRDPHLARLSECCERVFDCNVNINGYISLRPQPGFGFHWDDHEVLILQMLGRKQWEVQEPVALSPNRAIHPWATSGRPVWRGLIEPGQALHVPRGWGHDATAGDELTFHLTVTIPRLDGAGAARVALAAMDRDPAQRHIVDVGLGCPPIDADRLRPLLHEAVSPAGVDRAVAAYRSNVLARPTQAVTSLLGLLAGDRDRFVRSCHGGGVLWGDPGTTDDGPTLAYGRRIHHLAPEALAFLAPLLDGRARRAGSLEATGGDDRAGTWIDDASRSGLFEVVDPTDWGVVVDEEHR